VARGRVIGFEKDVSTLRAPAKVVGVYGFVILVALMKAEWVVRLPSKSMDFRMDFSWKRVASQVLTRREERS